MTAPTRLYRWFDADDVLLYVGITTNPAARANAHSVASGWFQWATRTEIEPTPYETREAALAAEAAAIRSERPIFNVNGADEDPRRRINAYLIERGAEPLEGPSPRSPNGIRRRAWTFKPDAPAMAAIGHYMEVNGLSHDQHGHLTRALNAMLTTHPDARTATPTEEQP